MKHPVKGIDHCFVLVDNLEAAAARYRALGFTLSPRGLHSAAKGTANYTIMFPHDYFELLGLLYSTPLNAARGKALVDHGEGLHAIACRIDTVEEAAEALSGLGIATHGLSSFERPVSLPDGGTAVAAFSTLAFDTTEVPVGSVFMCQHKTPEAVWLPELLSHDNTACGLAAILLVSENVEADADRFARLWAQGCVVKLPRGCRVETGAQSAPLELMQSADFADLYPDMDLSHMSTGVFCGLQITVADLNAAARCLRAADITYIETDRGLAVAPQDAAGVVLEFVTL